MATVGDGRASFESGGVEEDSRKRPFGTDALMWSVKNEDPKNVSQEAGQSNPTGVPDEGGKSASSSAVTWISELELMLKQKTFTRSEGQSLISLVQSRIMEDSPFPVIRLDASTTSGSLKRHKHGDERDNFHASALISREMASPADRPNKDNTIVTGQALKQGSMLIDDIPTCLPKTLMASPQHPTTIENLPDELLSNIFMRLLAKQLAQMRSVSKSWNSFISESSFVKSHLHLSINSNHQTLLHFNDQPCVAFELLCQSPHLQLTNFIKLPPKPQPVHYSFRVIGSVNGLICSSYDDFVIHIWNPSLSAMVTLPPYSMPSADYGWIKVFFRFGFDPKTDDYKVVKLSAFSEPEELSVIWWMDVEIYSMRNASWKLITKKFPSHITCILENEVVCMDGHQGQLHWLCSTNGSYLYPNTIVAFDLGSEIFHEIPLPQSILVHEYHHSRSIGVLAEKLCVMSWAEDEPCEVWVMEEYGVADSWVKRHVFSQFIGATYPFGFTSGNKFLFNHDQYCRLVLYDPVTQEAQILKNDCSYEENDAGKIVEYVDSLVWVAPAKHEN